MTNQKSHFIVLEGLDGTGKSTQVKLLQQMYSELNLPSHYIHFPRTDDESPLFGRMVAKFLRGDYGPIENVHPELVALIYAGDRYNASLSLGEKLNNGINVVADRYVFSNIGFQCAKLNSAHERLELTRLIFYMEYEYFKIPQPDLSVFLHVPIHFVSEQLSVQRTGNERTYLKGKEDIHEKSLDFQKKVEDVYLDACRLMPEKLHYLSCMNDRGEMLSPPEIHRKIADLLKEEKMI